MKFCIIGLGSFGTHLARQLAREGHELIGVDNAPAHVDALRDEIDFLLTADCSDITVFEDIPVADCDAVILAVGKDFEASLSIAANLKQMQVKRIICRTINPLHARLLRLLKVEELIIPEALAASWLARSLRMRDVVHAFQVGKGHEIVEVTVPVKMVGQTLQDLELRAKYDLNLVTVMRRKGATSGSTSVPQVDQILGVPAPDRAFEAGDLLLLFGTEKNVHRLLKDYGA